jgi:hypothetical protein
MIKTSMLKSVVYLIIGLFILQSCTDDRALLTPPPPPDESFAEEFDTIGNAYNRGWRFINKSVPAGLTNWMQGDASTYEIPAFSSKGTLDGYIITDYNATSGAPPTFTGIISNWAVSPSITIKNGDKIIFYTTRQIFNGDVFQDFIDRMQVCINTYGDDINVGLGDDPGNFSKVLLDINPFYQPYDPGVNDWYPYLWTRFEVTVNGLIGVKKRRFAFRYFLEGGGPGQGGMGSAVTLDKLSFISSK